MSCINKIDKILDNLRIEFKDIQFNQRLVIDTIFKFGYKREMDDYIKSIIDYDVKSPFIKLIMLGSIEYNMKETLLGMFSRARHYLNVFLITQKLYSVPNVVRTNTKYCFLFSNLQNDVIELNRLSPFIGLLMNSTPPEFIDLSLHCEYFNFFNSLFIKQFLFLFLFLHSISTPQYLLNGFFLKVVGFTFVDLNIIVLNSL